MYRIETEGWLKHYDFIILDILCLHIAFVLAYVRIPIKRSGCSAPTARSVRFKRRGTTLLGLLVFTC